ncbi:MAG: hypothetical protein KGY68_01825 [Candidatus Thermoplasmatota archaeon]|nr:hypothetical protein [Candidatus Thermoplasmatota archaeon]
MVCRKLPSLVIISLLITSGLAVFGSQIGRTEEGEQVHTIDFGVTLETESAIEDIYDGELDLLMDPIDGVQYQNLPEEFRMRLDTWEVRTSYKNLLINPAHEGHGTEAMEDAIDRGWINEPEEVQWLANNEEGEWTVNPFAHEDIKFAMQYLNRENITDELLDGYGDPRYSFMDTESDLWQEHFVDSIAEKYNLSAEGDVELMEQMIEDAMNEIKQNVAFGEVRFEDGYWQYRPPEGNWHDIEIIILARAEDWRYDLGDHLVDLFRRLGFDASSISPMLFGSYFFANPYQYDDLAFHIYTGGWISSQAEYYQEKGVSQYYAPWWGFMLTYGEESHWNYDEEGYTDRVQRLDNLSKELYQGRLESEEDYWNKMIESTQLGFEESVRVFLVTEKAFYPYDPDSLISAVPESINGYDTYFGPRTMRTDAGELTADIITGEDRPYMDNWNMEGGSDDVYGEYQRRLAREYGSWIHPQTGKPMQVNTYWMNNTELKERKPKRTHPYDINGDIEKDYYYNETGVLIENISIPDTAVDWIPALFNVSGEGNYTEIKEWKNASWLHDQGLIEDKKAAVKVTIDPHTEHVWHDGTDMKFRDIMHHYARRKELGHPGTEPYREATAGLLDPWWNSIHAIEWNATAGTYTVYGDYTLPIDDKIGDHYSIYPEDAHPLTYTGWNQLHATDDYNYDYHGDQAWIHQLSTEHSNDMISALEAMEVPPYLKETNFAGSMSLSLAMDQSEMDTIVSSFGDFVSETNHSFIGIGPFRIDEYDEIDHEMEITRWDQYGFPFEGEEVEGVEFPYGYWPAQFNVQEIRLDSVESSDEVTIGDEFEASGTGHYAHLYPEPEKIALTEEHIDDYRFTLRDEYQGEILVEVPSEEIDFTPEEGFSSFEAVIPTEDIEEGGDYTLQFEILEAGEEEYITAGKIITLTGPYFEVNIIDYPSEVEEGETLTVEYEVNNTGGGGDTQDINFIVDGELVDAHKNISLNVGENKTGEFTWATEDAGEFNLKVASNNDEKEITVQIMVYYELTINIEGEGTVELDGVEVEDGWTQKYEKSTEVTLEAIADDEWKFGEWQGTDETGDSITITMDEDIEITAVFEEEEDGVLGFTLSILIIASFISAVWYRLKIKDKNEK